MCSAARDLACELEETKEILARTRAELLETTRKVSSTSRLAEIAHDLRNSVGFMGQSIGVLGKYLTDLQDLLASYAELESQLPASALNLLSTVKKEMRLEHLREDSLKIFSALAEGSHRAETILKEFLAEARGEQSATFVVCELSDSLKRALTPLEMMNRGRIQILQDFHRIPKLSCRPSRICRMIENLVLNAIQAIPGQGRVWVTLRPDEVATAILISVKDDGEGIPEHVKTHIFDPFFTTKPQGLGTGLGLSIVREIVEEHRGRVSVDSQPGQGTCVEVLLPLGAAEGKR